MISRDALATFYFSTNGDDWVVCGRESTDCVLENKWLLAENECDWYSVECESPSNGDTSVLRLDFGLCRSVLPCVFVRDMRMDNMNF
jgi:hypothetical protein